MNFESFQYLAFACFAVFFVLWPLSQAFYGETAKAAASRLVRRCRVSIAHHLRSVAADQADHENEEVERHILDVMKQMPVRFPTPRAYFWYVSHLLFVAFFSEFVVSIIVFASSGKGMDHVDDAYAYATWFAVVYFVSIITYMCLEGTYRWVFAFATGGHILAGGDQNDE